MKNCGGYWFPDYETHMPAWMEEKNQKDPLGRLMYQGAKQAKALSITEDIRVFVDVGAHVGTWAGTMEHVFDRVIAFEPAREHIECLKKNAPKAEVFEFALGGEDGEASLVRTN